MCYSEASYFDGYHFAHIAARDEARRLAGIKERARRALESDRRRNGRALYACR